MWPFFFLLFPFAFAPASSSAQEKTVLFFGGTYSKKAETDDWARRASQKCGGTHSFVAVHSPAGNFPHIGDALDGSNKSAAGRTAKEELDKALQKYVAEIVRHPEREYVIAGHSSAGSLAKAVAHQVMLCQKKSPKCRVTPLPANYSEKYRAKIRLVLLDGGQTSKPDFKAVSEYFRTDCWSAKNGKAYEGLKNSCAHFHSFTAEGCTTSNCRHYAVINKSPPKKLDNYAGYRGDNSDQWQPNLDWVGDCGAAPASDAGADLDARSAPVAP